MSELTKKSCTPCEVELSSLSSEQIITMLKEIPKWYINRYEPKIYRNFQFKNFYQTMAFVNAIAWVAHQENHHPRLLEVDYNKCIVEYWTHVIEGLSENDFICAAKIDLLYANKKG